MQCPVCNVNLMIADRQGIEIDYCPKCRGLWLDRGELDKLIERSAAVQPQYHGGESHGGEHRERQVRHAPPVYHDRDEHRDYHGHHKHKRKSFIEEIFDF